MATSEAIPVECRELVFRYGRGAPVTRNVNLTLGRGDLFCLLGPNGSGKTTLIRQIVGDIRPSSGSVLIFGQPPTTHRAQLKRRIGVVPQHAGLFPTLTVGEHLAAFSGLKGLTRGQARQAVSDAAAACEIEPLLKRPAGELSGGQQRSLLLALALLADPEVLILDEPTVGLDPLSRRAVWRVIQGLRDAGKTILLTTHYLEEAEQLANRIGFFEAGALIREGTLESLRHAMGRSVRLAEAAAAGGKTAATHYFETVTEAEAYVRQRALSSYSIGQISLEDIYFRIAGGDRLSALEPAR